MGVGIRRGYDRIAGSHRVGADAGGHADGVGRLGGDEFAVLMPETDAQVADAAAKRLIVSLRNVFKGTPNVTGSIGVVSCTATDASTDDLLRRADQAMYDAKKSGKDRVVQVAI